MSEKTLNDNLKNGVKQTQQSEAGDLKINNVKVQKTAADTSIAPDNTRVQDSTPDNGEVFSQDIKIDISKITEEESIFDEDAKTKSSTTKKVISILFAFIAVFFVVGFSIYTVFTVDNALTIQITLNYSADEQYSQSIKKGSTFVIPADPMRSGYEFKGWFADENYTLEFDFTKPIKTDTTIYIKWAVKKYTISFRPNTVDAEVISNFNNSVFATDFKVEFNSSFTIPTDASGLDGGSKTFVEWNTASDGSGTAYELGDTLKMPARDLFLFAIWR